MCTVTWAHSDAGYALFFNRDELRNRPAEHPPKRWNTQGVAALAPLDDGGGGTWLAVNEHGLTAGLLNHYARESKSPDRPRSRGGIPLVAASHASVDEALSWISSAGLERFKPFHLILVDSSTSAALATWDGSKLEADRGIRPPVTTSSFCPEEVAAVRAAQFGEIVPAGRPATADLLETYHRSTNPRGGAWSVWMNRSDGCTRSMIRVDVGEAQVAMRYHVAHPGYVVEDGAAFVTLARAARKPQGVE